MEFLLLVYVVILTIWIAQLSGKVDRLQQGRAPIDTSKRAPASAQRIPAQSRPPERTLRTAPAQVRPAASGASFEQTVGAHWFQWLGIAALIIALVFFLKWAFDNGFIGPVGRTLIGYVLAAAAMAGGHYFRKRYGVWSLTFTGGGALASYIVTWTALHVYGLLPESAAMLLYVATTALTCILAGHYNALGLALCGIVGGFFTPVLTGDQGSVFALLLYLLLLDIGVLALAHVRRWHGLNVAAFAGTALWEFIIIVGDLDASFLLGTTFIVLFALLYLAIPAAYTLVRKLPSQDADVAILVASGLFHFFLLLFWFSEKAPQLESMHAFIAVVFGLAFAAYSAGVYVRNEKDVRLLTSSLALAVFFVSIAVPMHFDGILVPLLWSIEATVLLVASMELGGRTLQRFAWPVMGAAYLWFLLGTEGSGSLVYSYDGYLLVLFWTVLFTVLGALSLERRSPVSTGALGFALAGAMLLVIPVGGHYLDPSQSSLSFGQRMVQAAALIGGSYCVLLQGRRKWGVLTSDEKRGMAGLGVGVQIATVGFLTAEFLRGVDDGYLLSGIEAKYQAMQVGVSILWAVYGAIALIAGFALRMGPLRSFSVALLLLAVAKLTLVDFFSLGTGARVIGFTALGVLLVSASFLYQHFKDEVRGFLQGK